MRKLKKTENAPVAEVCEGDGHGDIDGGEEPEEDDGEQAADGENNESGSAGRRLLLEMSSRVLNVTCEQLRR